MISVSICINGSPILARSAVNQKTLPSGHCVYLLDDGSTIEHLPAHGATVLAIKMLKTIKEPKSAGVKHRRNYTLPDDVSKSGLGY